MGVVAFALLAIFGMFGMSLKSTSETVSQQEVLGLSRSLGDFLRSTNPAYGAGFGNVSNWVTTGTDPGLFVFVTKEGAVTNGLSNNSAFVSAASSLTARSGRLFRLVPTLSSNVPGIANIGDVATNAFIPLQVKIYAVPAVETVVSNLQPVFTYETAVFR